MCRGTDLVLVAAAVKHEAEVGEMEGCEQAQAHVRRQNAQRPLKQQHIVRYATIEESIHHESTSHVHVFTI